MNCCRRHRSFPPRAFTLVELLAVIAIIGLFVSLVVPSFTQVSRASHLSNAGQTLVDTLNLGRQVAMTQNRRVEVRLFQLPSSTSSSDLACRAIQLFVAQTSGSLKALTSIARFPEPVIVSDSVSVGLPKAGSATSTLLTHNSDTVNGAAECPVPGVSSYRYVSFYFLPTGETDLDPSKKWYVTLVLASSAVVSNGLPANYLTVQIDASSGKTSVFRP